MKPRALFTITFLLICTVFIHAQEKVTIWSEDFERDWYEDWHVNIGAWEVGTPTSGPQGAFTGNNCAATVLNGNYPSTVDTRLIRHTPFVVPSASENPAIRFWHWFSISGYDYGEVQIKTTNGEWETVSLEFVAASSDTWSYALIDLSDYADSTIQIAFHFKAASSYESSGWYIDDITFESGAILFNNPEDFELGFGDWSSDRGSWEVGTPSYGPDNAHGGKSCAGTNLKGSYSKNVDSRLVSPPFLVPSANENPAFRFWHWFSISKYDYGEVQIKTSNGEWETVSLKYGAASSNAWTRALIDLSDYADSSIQIGFDFISEGNYESSGWYIDDVELVTGVNWFNNPEDFESGLADWSVDRGTWEVGRPIAGPSIAHSGLTCAGTNLEGSYSKDVDSRLVSPPFVVPSATENPAFRFWHWFSISKYDWGEVQLSSDNGTTWEILSTQPIVTSSSSWTPYYVSLSSFAGDEVQLAFHFYSEHNYEGLGWYIDDVSIGDNSDLAVYAGPDISRVSGSSVTLNGTVSGGTEPYRIEWIPSEGLDDPTILNPKATPNDTTTYTLRVIDDHGCFRTDKVTVFADDNSGEESSNDILSFSLNSPAQIGDALINNESHNVTLEVESGSDLSSLIATFALSEGATARVEGVVQESGITSNDFSTPVNYMVTAKDGITAQGWEITVNSVSTKETEILSYSFGIPPQIGEAIINEDSHTVDIKVEYGTDVTALVAAFTLSDGATATVGEVAQKSGSTVNDFTEPLTYTLTAVDGETVQDWVVTVAVAKLNDTDILSYSFGIPPQTGNAAVNPVSHTVDIEVVHGTDVSALVADFTLSEGATSSVGEVLQESGTTTNDFTNPVSYKVTASDEVTVQDWVVSVDVAAAVGIEENVSHKLNLYPNPFSDIAIIEISNPDHSILTISVFNVLGNKVFEQVVSNTETIKFRKGNLPAGNYLLVLKREKVLESKVVIIE